MPTMTFRSSLIAGACTMLLMIPTFVVAQVKPEDLMDGAEIRLALQKLQVMGSALYVAAHPDDENTAFLSYLSKGRKVRTAYLSMTRGDGGQNLLGTETGEALGVIRTQELLAARRIDGAEQMFTRALDFGYSKNPEETLAIWGHDRILADVVWVIRRYRPDVIVTRFGTDGSGGHGHHTASAILAEEAFAAAADPARFPEQLKSVSVWQAKRILWNNWRPNLDGRDPNLPPILTVDLGTFNPLLGRSYTELAGQSRSMHKSQGFGAPERRGAIPNYFEHRAGDPAKSDLFDGVDLTWSRIPGGAAVAKPLAEAEKAFDPQRPSAILPALLRAHAALEKLPSDPLVDTKRRELASVIRSCAGLWLEAIATRPAAVPGGAVTVRVSALNRSDAAIALKSVTLPFNASVKQVKDPKEDPASRAVLANQPLALNASVNGEAIVSLPADQPLSQPYWLVKPASRGAFTVDDAALIGTPDNAPVLTARFTLEAMGEPVTFEVPVAYRWTDPVQGERYRPLEVLPPVTLRFDQPTYLFGDAKPREVRVIAQAGDAAANGEVQLALPAGWTARPASAPFTLAANAEQALTFTLTPATGAVTGRVRAEAKVGGRRWSQRAAKIDYPHIPVITLLPPADAPLIRTDLRASAGEIGYVMGSGDQVPEALRQMGFKVTLLSDDDIENGALARYPTIVTGVRAYNTRPRLRVLQPRLLDYVQKGGRLVVQYNTADEGLKDVLGPYPFTISRDRVTVEDAEMKPLKPESELLNKPNKIAASDFDGWVQERGLYFASPFDARYEPLFGAHDPGEPERQGGVISAHYGNGMFIYTGLSMFRQLPAGVPGAYRLFANLVSESRHP